MSGGAAHFRMSTAAMNIHNTTSIWQDAALCEEPVGRKRRRRAPGSAKYISVRHLWDYCCDHQSDAARAVGHRHVPAGWRCCVQRSNGLAACHHLQLCDHSSPATVPAVADVRLRCSHLRQQFCHCGHRLEVLSGGFLKSPVFSRNGDDHGMVELFFYANRQSAPMHIAIVPGTSTAGQAAGAAGRLSSNSRC